MLMNVDLYFVLIMEYVLIIKGYIFVYVKEDGLI